MKTFALTLSLLASSSASDVAPELAVQLPTSVSESDDLDVNAGFRPGLTQNLQAQIAEEALLRATIRGLIE